MKVRALALLWIVIGIAIWNGFFDLYVTRGAREYLQLMAESELGLVNPPKMAEVMGRAKSMGIVGASIWTAIVVAAGWATIAIGRRRKAVDPAK